MTQLFSRIFLSVCIVLFIPCCISRKGFTKEESEIIYRDGRSVMKLFKTSDFKELSFLRRIAVDVPKELLETDDFRILCHRMLETVNDPSDPGVGIAAPQIGISRRIIAVQRFDKPEEPFEIYVNPIIIEYAKEKITGPEGCLSVPDTRGMVERSSNIAIRYNDITNYEIRIEKIEGFTAVIFQHEIDHLDGVLFTDRINISNYE